MATTATRPEHDLRSMRANALTPYVKQIHSFLVGRGVGSGPVQLRIGNHGLAISPWEKSTFLDSGRAGSTESGFWTQVITQALALQAKGFDDLNRFEGLATQADGDRHKYRDEMVLDCAIGQAISRELRAIVEGFEASGTRGPARSLSDLATKVDAVVERLEPHIGEANVEIARDRSAQLVVEWKLPSKLPNLLRKGGSVASRSKRSSRGSGSSKVSMPSFALPKGTLHVAAGAGLVLALVLACWMLYVQQTSPAAVKMSRLDAMPGVVATEGSPPLVTVVVDPVHWDSADVGTRMRMVISVGSVVAKNGFDVAELETPKGKKLGRWARDETPILVP